MGKKLAKPTPVAPQRVKKASPVVGKSKVQAVSQVAEVEETEVDTGIPTQQKLRNDAEQKFPTPTAASVNDRGPTQLTISRQVRNRFRKACFVGGATMSDVIEGMMNRYADDAGF